MKTDTFYHIYNRANGKENLFRSNENYRFFLRQWAKYTTPIANTNAYCLMPNHFHFLVRTKSEKKLEQLPTTKKHPTGFKNLSGVMAQHFSNLFNSYSKAYNKMYERNGSLFQRPFKSKEILSDSYLTRVIIYIHHNPVHHGFTDDINNWKHSSIHSLHSKLNTRLKRNEVISWFGGIEQFKSFHLQPLSGIDKMELEFT